MAPEGIASGAQKVPWSVRWIRGFASWLRGHRALAVGLALAMGLGGFLAQGIYSVGNGESAVVRRFGRFTGEVLGSGLHFRWPGVDQVSRAKTSEVSRLEIKGALIPELSLITGDENIIETTLVVQYRILDLERFAFVAEAPEELLAQGVRAALVEAVAAMPVDDVLTSGKAEIQNRVRSGAQQRMDRYRSGLTVTSVNLQGVDPPLEASSAFREVNDAKAEASRLVNEAESRRDQQLSLARGEAGRRLREAQAAAESRLQKARGAAERFGQILAQSRRTPGQTRTDLYYQTLQKVLPRVRILVLAPGQRPRIDLNLLEGAKPRGASTLVIPPLAAQAPPGPPQLEPDNP